MGAAAQLHRRLALVCSGLTSVATESRVFAANLAVLLHIERIPLWARARLSARAGRGRVPRHSRIHVAECAVHSGRGLRLAAPALLLLLVFAVLNRALVILKRREGEPAGYFEIPIITPRAGRAGMPRTGGRAGSRPKTSRRRPLAAGLRRNLRDATAKSGCRRPLAMIFCANGNRHSGVILNGREHDRSRSDGTPGKSLGVHLW